MLNLQPVMEPWEPPPACVILTRYFYTPQERPAALLSAQLAAARGRATPLLVRALQGHQWAALLCLVSDLEAGLAAGPTPFHKSFLLTALNRGMFQVAAAEFSSFCYEGGQVKSRAWEKRRAEQYLFSRGKLLFE